MRLRDLPDHPLLDRLVRGRVWIPLLGLLLAGIVAMQVEVLKLGASIGRSIERGSVLATQNQSLRATVAQLADEQRIERVAASMGMVMPPPTAVGFLSARSGEDPQRAIAGIRAPNGAGFLSASTTNGSVVTLPVAPSSGTQTSSVTPGLTAQQNPTGG